jgi:hypothetical protein
MPKQLEQLDLPYALTYLWKWFCELSGGRGYSEVGPMPLTYSEIQAWSQLTKSDPSAWEVETLKMIDNVYLNEAMKK